MTRTQARRAAWLFATEEWAAARAGGPVCGVDEAGRGPLAGPVVAAAVVLGPDAAALAPHLADSKRLTAAVREHLAPRIRAAAEAWAVWRVGAAVIDRIGVERATSQAWRGALRALPSFVASALVDGPRVPPWDRPAWPLVDGDRVAACVMAAGILAKVARDREMRRWHAIYPAYGFDRHKGYATAEHRRALAERGPCPIHRASFLDGAVGRVDEVVGQRAEGGRGRAAPPRLGRDPGRP
jgi:ribonuclease HII